MKSSLLILRPRNKPEWLIEGYADPIENIRCGQLGEGHLYFMENIPDIPNAPLIILAYSEVEILRVGQNFWDKAVKNNWKVNTGTDPRLKKLIDSLTDSKLEFLRIKTTEDDYEKANLIDYIPYETNKVLISPSEYAVRRASYVFEHTLVYNYNVQMPAPANVHVINKNGLFRDTSTTKPRIVFVGDVEQLENALKELPLMLVTEKELKINLKVNKEKNAVIQLMENVKAFINQLPLNVKIEMNMYCASDTVYVKDLLNYKMKNVDVKVPQIFMRTARDYITGLITKQARLIAETVSYNKLFKTAEEFACQNYSK